jgi:hypothetical protein
MPDLRPDTGTLERVERGELDVPLKNIESARQSLLARITQATS